MACSFIPSNFCHHTIIPKPFHDTTYPSQPNQIKSSFESFSLYRSPHPKLTRSVVDSVFPLSIFRFPFSPGTWSSRSDLTWGFWNLMSAYMWVYRSEGVFWVIVGVEGIMFWRDRERESKELNGGVLCGLVRVLVVGDSGACVFLLPILFYVF